MDRKQESFSEVKYLGGDFLSPAAVDITDDAVYTFLWDKKPYVFMIKNEHIAKGYKSYFEALWKNAKP